jgi:hypothetical protein
MTNAPVTGTEREWAAFYRRIRIDFEAALRTAFSEPPPFTPAQEQRLREIVREEIAKSTAGLRAAIAAREQDARDNAWRGDWR